MLSKKFEQFWSIYPKRYNKTKTWDVFKRLNPNDELFDDMMRASTIRLLSSTLEISGQLADSARLER